MNTSTGRAAYFRSESREQFLNGHSVTDLKHVLARAVAGLEALPKGEYIDFNQLVYGTIQ